MTARGVSDAGSEPLEYTYTTWEGQARKAVVGVDAIDMTGAWSVYDVPVGGKHTHGWLVERIDAPDDKLDEATSLARAYAADQQRYHAGKRGDHAKADPLPRPVVDADGRHQHVEVPLAEIRQHVALAHEQAAGTAETQPVAA